jgi:hypothetical protein
MPRLLTPLDPRPRIPSLPTVTWWSEQLPPWEQQVMDRAVDTERTRQLSAFDDRVRTKGQVPLQIAANNMTPTLDVSTPPTWRNPFPTVRLPLPNRVWVDTRTTDNNWYGVDAVKNVYWEAATLAPAMPWLSTPWRAGAIRVYDLSKPWDQQRASITGGGLPMAPMTPHPDHLDAGAGGVRHALHFVVSGGYSSEPYIAPARKSDGLRKGHPLRAGARMRLTADAYERMSSGAESTHDAALLWAMYVYGVIVNDRTADVGHTLRLPDDPRLDVTIAPRLTDFEVLI